MSNWILAKASRLFLKYVIYFANSLKIFGFFCIFLWICGSGICSLLSHEFFVFSISRVKIMSRLNGDASDRVWMAGTPFLSSLLINIYPYFLDSFTPLLFLFPFHFPLPLPTLSISSAASSFVDTLRSVVRWYSSPHCSLILFVPPPPKKKSPCSFSVSTILLAVASDNTFVGLVRGLPLDPNQLITSPLVRTKSFPLKHATEVILSIYHVIQYIPYIVQI